MLKFRKTMLVLMAVIALAFPAGAQAATFNYAGNGHNVDVECSDGYIWKVTVYTDENYDTDFGPDNTTGARTTTCTYLGNFCAVPLYWGSWGPSCGFLSESANDTVSSLQTQYIATGYDVCIYKDANYSGGSLRLFNANSDWPTLPSTWNDKISSIKKVSESASC